MAEKIMNNIWPRLLLCRGLTQAAPAMASPTRQVPVLLEPLPYQLCQGRFGAAPSLSTHRLHWRHGGGGQRRVPFAWDPPLHLHHLQNSWRSISQDVPEEDGV